MLLLASFAILDFGFESQQFKATLLRMNETSRVCTEETRIKLQTPENSRLSPSEPLQQLALLPLGILQPLIQFRKLSLILLHTLDPVSEIRELAKAFEHVLTVRPHSAIPPPATRAPNPAKAHLLVTDARLSRLQSSLRLLVSSSYILGLREKRGVSVFARHGAGFLQRIAEL